MLDELELFVDYVSQGGAMGAANNERDNMTCTCKKDLEEKLLARFKEVSPDAEKHEVSLTGYALIFGDKLEQKGYMSIETCADFPLKKGGTKSKKETQNMIFTFCPFCGVKY